MHRAANANPTPPASPTPTATPHPVEIPEQGAWTDQGIVLRPGPPASWDVRLEGAVSPSTVVKKDGTYFLYYVGADGDRSTDGGPRHRGLGVATSTDGVTFTKHPGNPIITYRPTLNEEEGIFSAGATFDGDGNVVLYYGGMQAADPFTEEVRGDIWVTTSKDGLLFEEHQRLLNWDDPSVWGWGDELFPIGTFTHNGEWHVYYIAKGRDTLWDIGVASGPAHNSLTSTQEVLTEGSHIVAGLDPIWLAPDRLALPFVRDFDAWEVEWRTVSPDAPAVVSEPVTTYDFDNSRRATAFLDRDERRWMLFHADGEGSDIILKTAPATLEGGG